jgi:hypothetical protein
VNWFSPIMSSDIGSIPSPEQLIMKQLVLL